MKEAEIQEDTYSQFREYLEYPPYVSRKGMEAVIAEIAEKEPAAKNLKLGGYDRICASSPSWIKRPAQVAQSATRQDGTLHFV